MSNIITATQTEINIWETEHHNRIVKWTKDFVDMTIEFVLDDVKSGEVVMFKIS